MNLMSRLALFGGTPQRTKPFPSWPAFDENEEQALLEVLRSGKWWRYSYGEAVELKELEVDQPRSKVAEFRSLRAIPGRKVRHRVCQRHGCDRGGAQGAGRGTWRRSHRAGLHVYRYGQRGADGECGPHLRGHRC